MPAAAAGNRFRKFVNKKLRFLPDASRLFTIDCIIHQKIVNKMSDYKNFTSLALRNLGLSENQDIVEILNKFMKDNSIATGESALKILIRDYDKLTTQYNKLQSEKYILEVRLNDRIENLEAENNQLKQTLYHFSKFQTLLNKYLETPDSS